MKPAPAGSTDLLSNDTMRQSAQGEFIHPICSHTNAPVPRAFFIPAVLVYLSLWGIFGQCIFQTDAAKAEHLLASQLAFLAFLKGCSLQKRTELGY